MKKIFEAVSSFQPVYRINNREENLDFFRKTLGIRPLLEEGALVDMGGNETKQCRFQLEESPASKGYHEVAWGRDGKRHAGTTLLVSREELEQLLLHRPKFDDVFFYSRDGEWGLETFSPENDVFRVVSNPEFRIKSRDRLSGVDPELDVKAETDYQGLTDFKVLEVSLRYNSKQADAATFFSHYFDMLPDNEGRLVFPFVTIELLDRAYSDGAVATDTWDLEVLGFHLDPQADLPALAADFISPDLDYYLDPAGHVLSVKTPFGVELWFEK